METCACVSYCVSLLTTDNSHGHSHTQSDLFGLKTADEAGKIKFETTEGNHLQFTQVQLFGWLDKYM